MRPRRVSSATVCLCLRDRAVFGFARISDAHAEGLALDTAVTRLIDTTQTRVGGTHDGVAERIARIISPLRHSIYCQGCVKCHATVARRRASRSKRRTRDHPPRGVVVYHQQTRSRACCRNSTTRRLPANRTRHLDATWAGSMPNGSACFGNFFSPFWCRQTSRQPLPYVPTLAFLWVRKLIPSSPPFPSNQHPQPEVQQLPWQEGGVARQGVVIGCQHASCRGGRSFGAQATGRRRRRRPRWCVCRGDAREGRVRSVPD